MKFGDDFVVFTLDIMDMISKAEADLGLLQHPRWRDLCIAKRTILDVAAGLDPLLRNIVFEDFMFSTNVPF